MIVPPPTPNIPLNAPAAVAIAPSRSIRDDIAGHTTAGVRAHIGSGDASPGAAHRGPVTGGDLLRHRRRAGADRDARRGGPGAQRDSPAAEPPGAPVRARGMRVRPFGRRGAPARG